MIDCKKKKRSVEMSKAMLLSKQEMLMVQAGVAPILMRKDIYIYIIFFSRYILKVESTGFLGGLDVGYERRIKDESSDLSRKGQLAEMGKTGNGRLVGKEFSFYWI